MMNSAPRRKPIRKKLAFDEVSLVQHSVRKKDYGLMGVTEAKTPFPRKADPILASLLRQRLLAVLQEERSQSQENRKSDQKKTKGSSSGSISPLEVVTPANKEHLKFLRKRKQFYRSEFTISKQKCHMPFCHVLGESIGDDWRIVRLEFNISADSSADDL